MKSEEENKSPKPKVTYAYRVSMVRDKSIRYAMEMSNAVLGADLICKTIAACGQDDREHLIIVMLNTRNKVIGTNIISVGTVRWSYASLREVFKPAIVASAASIIIGHNHPSGLLDPSPEDNLMTKRIVAAAHLLDIIVHDHIIVDTESSEFFSYCDQGRLDQIKREAFDLIHRL